MALPSSRLLWGRYDESYIRLRMAALDAQSIATEAEARLTPLRPEAALALLGHGPDEKGFIAKSIATATDAVFFDPDTALPLVPHNARTGKPVPVAEARKSAIQGQGHLVVPPCAVSTCNTASPRWPRLYELSVLPLLRVLTVSD
jgi:hypothetical protein